MTFFGLSTNLLGQSPNGPESVTDAQLFRFPAFITRMTIDNIVMWVIQQLVLYQDSYFAGDLEDSKTTSGEILYIFGSRTFVPVSWMCKKPTSVSHSSTESEIISVDAGFALICEMWWSKFCTHRITTHHPTPNKQSQGSSGKLFAHFRRQVEDRR